jgi:hypothetical protein
VGGRIILEEQGSPGIALLIESGITKKKREIIFIE